MTMTALLLNVDEESVALALQEAGRKLDNTQGEAILDFSSVRRMDPAALRALEEFARLADKRSVKVVLSCVNVDVYKVLKLVKLTRQFSFENAEVALPRHN